MGRGHVVCRSTMKGLKTVFWALALASACMAPLTVTRDQRERIASALRIAIHEEADVGDLPEGVLPIVVVDFDGRGWIVLV